MTSRDPAVEPRRPFSHRYSEVRAAGGRAGNLLAKPDDGAYVSLSHSGRFPRHRPVAVVARRFGAGNERKELTRGRDERPFRRLPCAKRGAFAAEKRRCASPDRWSEDATPRRAAGALNGAPRMATRSSPPSFRVAMSESPALIPTVTTLNSQAARAARLRYGEVHGSAVAPSQSFPFFVTTQPIGAVRAAQTPFDRALRVASSRRERIYHVKQDDYRRLPPGRDPGGGAEEVTASRNSTSNRPTRSRCAATSIWPR